MMSPAQKTNAVLLAVAAAAVFTALTSAGASACPSCYGQAEGPVIDGMNRAIMAMIGITGFVLSGVVAMFVSIGRKAKRYNAAAPPPREAAPHNDTGAL